MKKFLAFAIAAVTMTVGCQKIQELVNPDKNQPSLDDTEPVEITFNTNVVNVETKGYGSVTSFDPAKHTLYVYGLNTSTPGTKEVTNVAATATEGTNPVALTLTGTYFYNGTTDKYDFYGYYVDDAADPTTVATDYTLSVTITGEQDILLAKALGAEAKDAQNQTISGAYSAKTARAGIVPTLQFEHQMSQFSFNVRNCGTHEILLKGLSLNTINKGTLTVAGDYQGLVASTDETDKEDLKVSTTDVRLGTVNKENTDSYTEVGGPIMVFSENNYTAILYLWQEGMAATTVRKVTVPVTIANDAEDLNKAGITEVPGALKGYGYDINITVYSLEEISVTASLVDWKEGNTFAFDTEDNDGDGENDVTWPVSGEDDVEEQEPTTSEFAVSPVTQEIEANETSFTVGVTLDGVAPSTNEDITVDPGELQTPTFNTGNYTFTVSENTSSVVVSYSVKFTYGETVMEVTVTQKAATENQQQ